MPKESESKEENVNSSRPDGRKPDEIRPMVMKVGIISRANGSAYVEFGKTKVIAAVYGPDPAHPRHMADPKKAILKCRYCMLPFSVEERKKPGPDRRSIEISKVIKDSLSTVVLLEEFPKCMINLDVEVIQADAGTRVAALTAASLALADAGIPMRGLISAVACGRANGQLIVDLNKEEEDAEDAVDMPIAMLVRNGEISLLQMDGDITIEELEKILSIGENACKKVYEMQRKALLEKYEKESEGVDLNGGKEN